MATSTKLSAFLAQRESGETVRKNNVSAVEALAKIMSTSLGPQGSDKMLIDNIGEITVTNDGATILKLLDVRHPAAKVLVDLSKLQDSEVGDGTTSVVIIAAELLKAGKKLLELGLHCNTIIQGYKFAGKEAVRCIQKTLCRKITKNDRDLLKSIVRTSLSSKIAGLESSLFEDIVVDAILKVEKINENGKVSYPVAAVSVVEAQGKSAHESMLVEGYALCDKTRASQLMPMSVSSAKIAFLDFPLKQYRAPLGVEVRITDPEELRKIREIEKNITRDRAQKIIQSDANVLFSSEGLDDMTTKYFVEAKVFVVKRVAKGDLYRLAKATGGRVCTTMAINDEGEEYFNSDALGQAGEVYEERVADWDFIFIKGEKIAKATTIILRGANFYMLSELNRSIHDALCVVSRALESAYLNAGGGAVEAALHSYLMEIATKQDPKMQAVINEYAKALLCIPRTLALNGCLDFSNLLAELTSHYHKAFSMEDNNVNLFYGININEGIVQDNLSAGVIEPSVIKTRALRYATEAAITLLRVDDIIVCEQ